MLDEAEEQAEQIIEDAKQQAEVEAQQLIDGYIRKGYDEGHEQAEQECAALKQELEDKILRMYPSMPVILCRLVVRAFALVARSR